MLRSYERYCREEMGSHIGSGWYKNFVLMWYKIDLEEHCRTFLVHFSRVGSRMMQCYVLTYICQL
jgi:hypothetical protein